MFRFQKGDEVVLLNSEGHTDFLPVGSRGVVFCQYTTTPTAYEVTFWDSQGEEFGTIVYENELGPSKVAVAQPLREAVGAA